jgi:hypothetical protein
MRPGLISPLAKEDPELLVPEQFGDLLSVRRRRHRERTVFMEFTVGHQRVKVGVVSEEIPKVWMAFTAAGRSPAEADAGCRYSLIAFRLLR